ncbi:methylated-DNA/protein-cysteinemethyltransferase [Pyrolobus fumarii 1A]|uniref:Methylated-DNA--protein-cysteine methyltransferase n=1 Tax=Pyrolobus fumarii (strain DSM 11204 / 1A) TaxID=694429 RepID=G0EC82_PYRF1|nr:MGMT family protein [Pyrolobus fumarii]AEM39452.1 methylated-DNA/protein-cysteinemethyltransferase [Pyrolobus fumarii 1A]
MATSDILEGVKLLNNPPRDPRRLKAWVVYLLLSMIPPGRVVTYSLLARLANTSPRAVGSLMRANKYPILIPCHRVVSASGDIHGFSLGGPKVKEKLLRIEGVKVENDRVPKRYIITSVDDFWRILEENGYTLQVDIA